MMATHRMGDVLISGRLSLVAFKCVQFFFLAQGT
jgi:hypothetical protein